MAHGIQNEVDRDSTSVDLGDNPVLVDRTVRQHSTVSQHREAGVDEMYFAEKYSTLVLVLLRSEQIASRPDDMQFDFARKRWPEVKCSSFAAGAAHRGKAGDLDHSRCHIR